VRRLTVIVCVAALAALCGAASAQAVSLQRVGDENEFDQPIFVTSDPADADRLFIVEREGTVEEYVDGEKHLFAEIGSLVACCVSERGLLSIALPPDFDATGRFYAAYTGSGTPAGGAVGDLHVDAFTVAPGEPGAISRQPIITWPHSVNANHNGGQLQFGPDGHLYIGAGDGGSGGDPEENAQNKDVLLGKILRIDPVPGADPPYTVPAGNPFVGDPNARPEVWAYGLRNPWRFSFDSLTGDMVIGDVGQGLHEEIDYAKSSGVGLVGGGGRNYGWNCREGFSPYTDAGEGCVGAGAFTEPILDYPHSEAGGGFSGCSITGGYVVRDPGLGSLYGRYIYSDFCSGGIRSLRLPADGVGAATEDRTEEIPTADGKAVVSPVSFGEDACRRLYVASSDGGVYRLVGDTEPSCVAVAPPPPASGGSSSAKQYEDALPTPGEVRRPPRVRLTATRTRSGRFTIEAEAVGCQPRPGDRIFLGRGGDPQGSKPVGADCIATFKVSIHHPSTFRAYYRVGKGTATGRSRVLSLG
jgi:hypothetical protein